MFENAINGLDWSERADLKNMLKNFLGVLNEFLQKIPHLPKNFQSDLQKAMIKAFEKKWAFTLAEAFYPIFKMADGAARARMAAHWTDRFFLEAPSFTQNGTLSETTIKALTHEVLSALDCLSYQNHCNLSQLIQASSREKGEIVVTSEEEKKRLEDTIDQAIDCSFENFSEFANLVKFLNQCIKTGIYALGEKT